MGHRVRSRGLRGQRRSGRRRTEQCVAAPLRQLVAPHQPRGPGVDQRGGDAIAGLRGGMELRKPAPAACRSRGRAAARAPVQSPGCAANQSLTARCLPPAPLAREATGRGKAVVEHGERGLVRIQQHQLPGIGVGAYPSRQAAEVLPLVDDRQHDAARSGTRRPHSRCTTRRGCRPDLRAAAPATSAATRARRSRGSQLPAPRTPGLSRCDSMPNAASGGHEDASPRPPPARGCR